jgi:Glycosyltransferase
VSGRKKIWEKEDEVKDIQSFDIGIMPLIDDKWTKGKCALKLLQYMSCGLASVSSTTDVTSYIIKDGVNGFLASTNSQWLEKIKFLLENPDKLKTVGGEARKSIDGKFDSKTIALKYAAVFEDVCR